jgi:Spy/CpxP family protein refolding chaperone
MDQIVRTSMRVLFCLCVAGIWIAAPASGDATTQPSVAVGGIGGRRPGPAIVLERLRRAVDQLTLSDDQKSKVGDIFDQASQQADDLSQSLGDLTPEQRLQKLSDFSKQIRQQLSQVLTPDQMQTLGHQLGSGPTTRPGGRGGQGGGMLEIFGQAIAKLDLTADQKQQISELMTSTRQKVQELRQRAAGGDNIQADMQQVRQDVRAKLQEILTPDQMQTFTQTVQQLRQEHGGGAGGPRPNAQNPQVQSSDQTAPTEPKQPADIQVASLDAGSPVPNVKVYELNGPTFDPAKYKGKVIVLEFGSLSCPVFRDQVKQMEQLRLSEDTKAFFMVVYTREAFPAGDKDVLRNKEQGFSVPQARSLDERRTEARLAQEKLGITIPIAVDSMDDAASTAFDAFPNGAIVIGKDGNIAARQQWTNPDTLRNEIDDAAAQATSTN